MEVRTIHSNGYMRLFDNDEMVTVLAKKNGGKASALNYGIAACRSEYVIVLMPTHS